MAYVAVKGGERAIDNAHAWLAEVRRGDPSVPELGTEQIEQQLGRAVDRVMAEGSLHDRGPRSARGQAGAGRSRGGCVPAARVPDHPAPLRRERSRRDRHDVGPAAHLGNLQGHAWRPGAWPHLRLHASPAGLQPRGPWRAAGRGAPRRTRPGGRARRARDPARRGTDRDGPRRNRRGRAGRPHAPAARLSSRPGRAPSGAGARRRGLPARTRLLDAARLGRIASFRGRDPRGRGCRDDRAPGAGLSHRHRRRSR